MFQRMFVSTLVKESLLILLAGAILGGVLNQGLIRASFNGELLTKIGQKQTAELETKAGQIPFIKLQEARALFNKRAAVFVDSRSSTDYRESHIQGARGLPLVSLVQNRRLAGEVLPDKSASTSLLQWRRMRPERGVGQGTVVHGLSQRRGPGRGVPGLVRGRISR